MSSVTPFSKFNGSAFVVRARAPLRLGFAGGGTDVSPYCDEFGGAVLNATISMYAYATIAPRYDGCVSFQLNESSRSAVFPLTEDIPDDPPFRLLKGVYDRIVRDFCGGRRFPCALYTHCDAPAGSGLGSSSTLVVALISAFQELLGLTLGEYEIARLAYSIEREELGLEGGKQDQYAAAFGGFNFIEFGPGDRVIVNPLRVKRNFISELEASLLLYYTGTSRSSAAIINEQKKNLSGESRSAIESANALKLDAAEIKEAVLTSDASRFGKVLNRAWISKKQMAKTITNPVIDEIYEFAMCNGAYAGKVSGAGGGGFMMFVCDPSKRPALVAALREREGTLFNAHFVESGCESWTSNVQAVVEPARD